MLYHAGVNSKKRRQKGLETAMNHSFIITNNSYKLVRRDTEAPPPPLTALVTGRNTTASFQIVLSADKRYTVNLSKEPWFSEKGALYNIRPQIISSFSYTQHIEGMVTDDDGLQKADILLSRPVVEQCPDIKTAIWVELAIPADCQPGSYKVKVALFTGSMYEDEQETASAELMLTVKPYILPNPKEYRFYLDLWQHNSNIARKHEVTLWSDRHFEIMERYIISLAALGQKSVTIVASEVPWRGQSCFLNHRVPSNLFEYSIIQVTRNENGEFEYDFTSMQRYIDICKIHGICGDIELFGLTNVWVQERFDTVTVCEGYPENILIRYYDKKSSCYKYMRDKKEIIDYIKAIEAYFINTNQISIVRVTADEPTNIQKYRESLSLLRSVAPSFVFKTAINHAEFVEEFKDAINDFAPSIECASSDYEKLMKYREELDGKRFLWYICCGPEYPNTFIKSHLLESRLIGVLTSMSGFDGFLRWNYTVWPDDPRKEIRYASFPAGDTNFVYPSSGGDVLLSLRYKQLKLGIEDFELLEQMKKAGKAEIAEYIFKDILKMEKLSEYYKNGSILPLENICSLSYSDFATAREKMLDALEK